jgi:UDP-GlcNAc3NAcA epimerase
MKIVTIVGARPQFVKAAVVSRAFRACDGVREVLVHTGQHFDANMNDVFFSELEIPTPDHHLGISGGTHGLQTGRMLEAVEAALLEERPDWVLVYGDTNSTLAGALAAAKLHIPVAHVEAGLRSFNRRMPEEVNRVLTDHAATLLFAPTTAGRENLLREGVDEARIRLVGDVMYDATRVYGRKAEAESRILERVGLAPGAYVLSTIHRAENTDDPRRLRAIIEALDAVTADVPVVLPLHPRTRRTLEDLGLLDEAGRCLRLIEPVGYLDMLMLEQHARLIATDSGGVQKEAFFFRVPCVTLRDETEWVELVEAGWNRLVPPTDARAVEAAVRDALADDGSERVEAELYGDGHAAEAIVEALVSHGVGGGSVDTHTSEAYALQARRS